MLVRYIKLLINLMICVWQLICFKMKYLTFYTLNCHQMELVFRKYTITGLDVNFTSLVSRTYRTSWIRSLVTRTSRIWSIEKLPSEINIIKRFASWNDFPKSFANSIINITLNTPYITADSSDANEANNGATIYFCVPYYGDKSW